MIILKHPNKHTDIRTYGTKSTESYQMTAIEIDNVRCIFAYIEPGCGIPDIRKFVDDVKELATQCSQLVIAGDLNVRIGGPTGDATETNAGSQLRDLLFPTCRRSYQQ